MDSVSAARKGFGGAYKDRISELPDEILILILSFVFSAKDVKRTCILSKRWRNVWAFVPSLEFRHLLTTDGEGFVGFVDNFLQLRNPSDLHTFSLNVLCVEHSLHLEHVEEWICYAVRNNVKVLNFSLYTDEYYLQVPDCIFSCPSLEELSLLYTCVEITIPKFIDLGNLKTLHIEDCRMCGKELERLISACTCLEDLTLRCCYIYISSFQLSSDTIKRLEMCNWDDPRIRIIPSPTTFTTTNVIFSLGNLPCLVNATIKYDNPEDDDIFEPNSEEEEEDDDDVSPINPKLISGLSNATNLDLFMATCKRIPEAELSKLPTFHNLRSLKLGGRSASEGNSQILVHFLRCSPNLEELGLEYDEILQLPKSGEVGFDCPCLEKVEIKVARWSNPQVHELVKFLHEHAKKLLKINIVYDRSCEGIQK